ncbi:DUF3515 family protein [Ornithinimicrobium pekingense]|uniref:DUF3515 family protein n=1 Tax=Ornithinimicrobium pekingense TaxID=384677 RepID=A0ABQ2F8F9_9MICO|nr:DUF3515 family protein [Ornithinimicrobium pekingense]GGK62762.1 hypothetical protein GCM10011509_09030 [Ornithinimicrobium pekingense]
MLLLGACGDDAVRAVPFDESDSPACQAVADRWPDTVGGLQPRVTAVQSRGVAAWGDPPVVARCGKQAPAPTTDPCIDIDGVDWVATELDDGTMFTTYGRSPAVEVLVPAEYDTAPLWLPAFGEAVRQVEQTLGACSSVTG